VQTHPAGPLQHLGRPPVAPLVDDEHDVIGLVERRERLTVLGQPVRTGAGDPVPDGARRGPGRARTVAQVLQMPCEDRVVDLDLDRDVEDVERYEETFDD
jgi:hypothetical protein